MSMTLAGLLNQACSIYTTKAADEFGNGATRVTVGENIPCRFVLAEQREYDSAAGGYLRTGSAAAWMAGRVPVEVGDVFVDLETRIEYRVVRISMPRDLIAPGVDHTKVTLE